MKQVSLRAPSSLEEGALDWGDKPRPRPRPGLSREARAILERDIKDIVAGLCGGDELIREIEG